MNRLQRSLTLGLTVVGIAGCTKPATPTADSTSIAATTIAADPAADEAAIRELNASWFKTYNSHDAAALAAFYADDAVLMMPGVPTTRGPEAIKAAYQRDMDGMAKGGFSNAIGADSEAGVSGDLAWESNTFTVTDKSGKKVDSGKYVTVFERRNGKWMIVRDIWNSDAAPTA